MHNSPHHPHPPSQSTPAPATGKTLTGVRYVSGGLPPPDGVEDTDERATRFARAAGHVLCQHAARGCRHRPCWLPRQIPRPLHGARYVGKGVCGSVKALMQKPFGPYGWGRLFEPDLTRTVCQHSRTVEEDCSNLISHGPCVSTAVRLRKTVRTWPHTDRVSAQPYGWGRLFEPDLTRIVCQHSRTVEEDCSNLISHGPCVSTAVRLRKTVRTWSHTDRVSAQPYGWNGSVRRFHLSRSKYSMLNSKRRNFTVI